MITNALWYRAKFLLRSRGYPMSYILHFHDLSHLSQLIHAEPNPVIRARYARLQRALYTAFGITICLFIAFIASEGATFGKQAGKHF